MRAGFCDAVPLGQAVFAYVKVFPEAAVTMNEPSQAGCSALPMTQSRTSTVPPMLTPGEAFRVTVLVAPLDTGEITIFVGLEVEVPAPQNAPAANDPTTESNHTGRLA